MKKFLALALVVAAAGFVSTASAMDRSGKIGFGFQGAFSTNGVGSSAGDWSLKYGMSSDLNLQFLVGFDYTSKVKTETVNAGARILYDLVENEMSDFYTGLGILYQLDDDGDATAFGDVLRISVPLGFEWSFASVPEIGISAEAGALLDYQLDNPAGKAMRISSVGGFAGFSAHYYF